MLCVFIAEHPATLHIETSTDTEERDEKKKNISDCMHFFLVQPFYLFDSEIGTDAAEWRSRAYKIYVYVYPNPSHHNPCPFNGRLADWQTSSVPPTFPKSISQVLKFYVNTFTYSAAFAAGIATSPPRCRCSHWRRLVRRRSRRKPYANAIHFEFLFNFSSFRRIASSLLTLCCTLDTIIIFSFLLFSRRCAVTTTLRNRTWT